MAIAFNSMTVKDFLMETRICPKCNKVFYSARVGGLSSCPHCRYKLFNGRCEERTRTILESAFAFGRMKRAATMIDYSRNGARIIYQGESLPVNTIIELQVDELKIQRSAKVVWTKNEKLKSATGLRFYGKENFLSVLVLSLASSSVFYFVAICL